MITLWLFVAAMVTGASPGTPSPPSSQFLKEDHLTGANYLALDGSGRYVLIGREHMGVWELERGKWVRTGSTLAFTPDDPETNPYQGRRITHDDLVFLVWSTDGAAGIVVPLEEVKRDLARKQGLARWVRLAA